MKTLAAEATIEHCDGRVSLVEHCIEGESEVLVVLVVVAVCTMTRPWSTWSRVPRYDRPVETL